MKRKIKLNESDIRRIIMEEINNWAGSYNVIDRAQEYQDKKKMEKLDRNREIMVSESKRIQHVLHTALTTLKHGLSLPTYLNPTFIKRLPNGEEKEQMEDLLEMYKKITELYDYLGTI